MRISNEADRPDSQPLICLDGTYVLEPVVATQAVLGWALFIAALASVPRDHWVDANQESERAKAVRPRRLRSPWMSSPWFDVSRPTVSDASAALRRKDLLTHEPVPEDRRRTVLVLTPSGRKVARQLAGWDEPVRAELATLPRSTKVDTLHLLLALIGRMQQSGLVSVARTCLTCRFYRPHHEPVSANHCTLLDVPLPPQSLRLDCPEHEPAA